MSSFEKLKPDILFTNQYKNDISVSCASSVPLDAVDVVQLPNNHIAAVTGL
jgi:hypothetical protein